MDRKTVRGAGWAALALVLLTVTTAGLWAPIDPAEQADPAATRLLPPGSKRILVETTEGRRWVAESIARRGDAWHLVRDGETVRIALDGVARVEPLTFRWGTDRLGRDVLSRTLHGGRASLLVALVALFLATALGVAVGATAGSSGGWIDEIAMRVCDGLLGFPRLVLLLVIATFTSPTLGTLVVVLAATSWMATARLVRAEVRSLRRRDFVLAAEAGGTPPWRVLAAHVLPHLRPTLAVDTTLRFGELILLEATLSYLGLGVPPPTPSWGSMISDGQADLVRAWWVSFFPGVALVAVVLLLTLVSDTYRRREQRA